MRRAAFTPLCCALSVEGKCTFIRECKLHRYEAGPCPLSCFISPGYPLSRHKAAVVLTQHTCAAFCSLGMRESYCWEFYFNNWECLKIISRAIYFVVLFNMRHGNFKQKSWEEFSPILVDWSSPTLTNKSLGFWPEKWKNLYTVLL